MLQLHTLFASGLLLLSGTATGMEPQPEIHREVALPQAVGVAHTLRTIPEACARFEGRFTGQARSPYALNIVRTGSRCMARAQLVDAVVVRAGVGAGWILNDLIRVPRVECPSQQAVIHIWRKEVASAAPKLDAQGRVRVYLKDSMAPVGKAKSVAVPQFAVAMAVEGKRCEVMPVSPAR